MNLSKEEIIQFALKIEEESHCDRELVKDGELTDFGCLVVLFSMISICNKIHEIWFGGKKND